MHGLHLPSFSQDVLPVRSGLPISDRFCDVTSITDLAPNNLEGLTKNIYCIADLGLLVAHLVVKRARSDSYCFLSLDLSCLCCLFHPPAPTRPLGRQRPLFMPLDLLIHMLSTRGNCINYYCEVNSGGVLSGSGATDIGAFSTQVCVSARLHWILRLLSRKLFILAIQGCALLSRSAPALIFGN